MITKNSDGTRISGGYTNTHTLLFSLIQNELVRLFLFRFELILFSFVILGATKVFGGSFFFRFGLIYDRYVSVSLLPKMKCSLADDSDFWRHFPKICSLLNENVSLKVDT